MLIIGALLARNLLGAYSLVLVSPRAARNKAAIGGAGNDVYHVIAGDRVIEGTNGGADTVNTTTSYVLTAGSAVETVRASNPTLNIAMNFTGNALGQTIHGTAGTNAINGRGGADTMSGLGGNDTYNVDTTADKIIEAAGQGTDRLFTSSSFALAGAASVERMQTTAPTATTALNLIGNGYLNTLIGNNGTNMLNGAGGSDTLLGAGGADSFRLSVAPSPTNIDTIQDFKACR